MAQQSDIYLSTFFSYENKPFFAINSKTNDILKLLMYLNQNSNE